MKFDDKVYKVISKIPKGRVSTYKEVGRVIGTKAYRAVGQALKRNPNAPKIPCHRVISSSGKIGGYNGSNPGDIKRKIMILKKEGVKVVGDKIELNKYFFKFRK